MCHLAFGHSLLLKLSESSEFAVMRLGCRGRDGTPLEGAWHQTCWTRDVHCRTSYEQEVGDQAPFLHTSHARL